MDPRRRPGRGAGALRAPSAGGGARLLPGPPGAHGRTGGHWLGPARRLPAGGTPGPRRPAGLRLAFARRGLRRGGGGPRPRGHPVHQP
ncbi:MAG: hypothetical protein B9S27_05400 [Opitutia bacterium Tous-C8FEB]|nr:MAG: hypothetical protein B9S27_05400 [Opitutae bacterium Tous-C8FEB]